MIKCCIFDLDGTLLETLVTIRYYVNNTLAAFGVEPITEEECRVFVGKGARNLIHRVLESRGVDTPEFFDKVFDHYNAAYDAAPYHLTYPYDGIIELLDRLHAAGIKLAVLSNKPDFATRVAINHFFGDRFDIVRGGIEGIALKPAPDAPLALLADLGCTADEAAYVGDSEVDVICAANYKPALPIFVDWGFRTREELAAAGARLVVSDVAEVGRIILENT